MKISLAAAAVAATLSCGAVSAATIDFEDVPFGTYSGVTTGGVTFTLEGGTGTFDVVDASPGGPISGHALISYFQNDENTFPFKATMAGGFSSFSIGMGDYGADDDEGHLMAYDAGGGLLDSDTLFVPDGSYDGGILSVSSATPIAYVLFYETGTYPGAVYWDSVEFTAAAVPEPETYALMLLGLAGVAAVARRRRT